MQEEAEVQEGAVETAREEPVSEVDVAAGVCPECRGAGGHHYLNCGYLTREGKVNEDVEELGKMVVPDPNEGIVRHEDDTVFGEEAREALPPTDDDLMSNDMLWLIAKCCHEVNRAFCAEITSDHSHAAWEDTSPELRASIYSGVVGVFEHPDRTAEQSHAAWVDYKVTEGWTFSNVKSEALKTHPNLAPWHQLHAHERFKDTLFITICKTMMGGEEKGSEE